MAHAARQWTAFPNSDEKTKNSKVIIMKNKKELKSIHRGLLQSFAWALILTIGFINFGCQCDCEEANDEYYVKYELYSDAHPYIGIKVHTTVNNEDNSDMNFTFDANTQWETIIGPVQKGYNAILKVSSDAEILLQAKIHVSKNDSPFTLKANDGSVAYRNSVQLSYKIDY